MNIRNIVFLVLVFFSQFAIAEIPDWYKEGVEKFLIESETVVLYRVNSVLLIQSGRTYSQYQVNAQTLKVLKGQVEPFHCYTFSVEGKLEDHGRSIKEKIGEERLAIVDDVTPGVCSFIDVGYSAPGTEEYIELFESILFNKQ